MANQLGALDMTPIEDRNGLLYKREDAYSRPNGVNGSKLRACFHLVAAARRKGAMEVVSASSVLSPQAAMSATIARELEMESVTIVGGTVPEKAVRNHSIRLAKEAGSEIVAGPAVGYNPALQAAARDWVAANPGSWQMPYGITTPEGASEQEIKDFLYMGANQVRNIPDEVETLILPFGSGNTAAGVLYGLLTLKSPANLRSVKLMTIGPDRFPWLEDRLEGVGAPLFTAPFEIDQIHLHPVFAEYGDAMPETLDSIKMHPTYEGKIVRYLNLVQPEWWTARDGKTLMWIVGGPLS